MLEYGYQARSYGITQYLSDEIERIQKRALKIIHLDLHSFNVFLTVLKIVLYQVVCKLLIVLNV